MMMGYGGESNIGQVRSVPVKSPRDAWHGQTTVAAQWRGLNYPAEPDHAVAVRQHDTLIELLRRAGAEVHLLPAVASTPRWTTAFS